MADKKIKLTWDPLVNNISTDPQTVDLIEGDTLVFTSEQGPLNLKFDPPENFAVVQVVGGALSVRVLKRAKAQISCGVVIDGVTHGFPDEMLKSGVTTTPGEA